MVVLIIIVIIIIVIFIIAGIIVCLNKSHRLYVLICADVISTTLAVCTAWQTTCITATPLVCTWRSWIAAASNTLQNWRWCNGSSTCDWGQDSIVKLPTTSISGGVTWSAALQIRTCRRARLTCCTAASSVGGRLFILGGSFFLLTIEHLRLARDVIPLPPYSFDKKERPSSIHASSVAAGFTNSLRVITSEFRTKLIAFIYFLPKWYETLSHPESAWAASRPTFCAKNRNHTLCYTYARDLLDY